MIRYVKGDLFSADTQALVNTVNTVGVMGKGIALQFKERFPNNYTAYVAACKSGELIPGKMLVVKERILSGEEKIIINFPTNKNWKHKSRYEYIEVGLIELVRVIEEAGIISIAIPPLGCGNGGLDWNKVQPLMEKYLGSLTDTDIVVYEPNDAIKELLKKEEPARKGKLTPAGALLLYAMFYYESLGENTSLFVANKLAYLFQRLGEKTFGFLSFKAHYYGPYSPQVAHLVHSLNGQYLRGTEQMELTAFEPIELQYDKMQEVARYVRTQLNAGQVDNLKKLILLIRGYESALSLEVLTSVDFVRKQYGNISKEEAIVALQGWSERKKNLFKEKHISTAFDHLDEYAANICAFQ